MSSKQEKATYFFKKRTGLLKFRINNNELPGLSPDPVEFPHKMPRSTKVNTLDFIRETGTLVGGSRDGDIRFWNSTTGELLDTIKAHSSDINNLVVLPEITFLKSYFQKQEAPLKILASCSDDKTIKFWDTTTHEQVNRHGMYKKISTDDPVRVMAFVCYPLSQFEKKFDVKGCILAESGGNSPEPDSGSESGKNNNHMEIRLWNIENGEFIKVLRGHTGTIYTLAVLPDGRLVSGSGDKTIIIWNIKYSELHSKTGRPFEQHFKDKDYTSSKYMYKVVLTGHTGAVNTLAVFPDGTLASGSQDSCVKLWDTKTGQVLKSLQLDWFVDILVALPDGKLAICPSDTKVIIWDPKTGEKYKIETDHKNPIDALISLSDGMMASAATPGYFDKSSTERLSEINIWNIGYMIQRTKNSEWKTNVDDIPPSTSKGECNSCQDQLTGNKIKLPCAHIFHKECLGEWLRRMSSYNPNDDHDYRQCLVCQKQF